MTENTPAGAISTPSWTPLALWFALCAVLVVVYWRSVESIAALWSTWSNDNYSHGWLVFAISVWLLWRSRRQIATAARGPYFPGFLWVGMASVAWLFAHIVAIQIAEQLVVVAMIAGLALTVFGKSGFRYAIFPLAYLLLAIPVWDALIPALEKLTTVAVTIGIRSLGVPVLREGFYITIPEGQFLVERGCSGIRYLNAALALGTLFAYLNYRGLTHRFLYVLVTALIAIVANWLRVLTVIMIGHFTSMNHPLIKSHLTLGWILFAVLILPLCWLATRHGESTLAIKAGEPAPAPQVRVRTPANPRRWLAVAVGTVFCIALAPAFAGWLESRAQTDPSVITVELPDRLGGWRGSGSAGDSWYPVYKGAASQSVRSYEKADVNAAVFLALYTGIQRQGSELVGSTNRIADPAQWDAVSGMVRVLPGEHRIGNEVYETQIRSARGERRWVWHWYLVAGRPTARDSLAKLLGLWGLVTANDTSAVIALSVAADDNDDPARSRAALLDIKQAMDDELRAGRLAIKTRY